METQADIPTWIMALTALGFFGGMAAIAFILHERRRIAFEKIARRRGLVFHELVPRSLRLPGDFIREVESGIVVNSVLRRALQLEAENMDIVIGELLRYRARSGGGERGYYPLAVGMIRFKGHELPRFSLDPEKLRHKLTDLKNGTDIDFEEAPVFSSRYRLTGDSEPAIRRFFTPERRAFFENHSGLQVRSYGETALMFRRPGLFRWAAFRPSSAEKLLDETLELARALE